MKLFCTVHGKPAVIVGYTAGFKGKPMVMVITEGKLRGVKLRDIVLDKGDFVPTIYRKTS